MKRERNSTLSVDRVSFFSKFSCLLPASKTQNPAKTSSLLTGPDLDEYDDRCFSAARTLAESSPSTVYSTFSSAKPSDCQAPISINRQSWKYSMQCLFGNEDQPLLLAEAKKVQNDRFRSNCKQSSWRSVFFGAIAIAMIAYIYGKIDRYQYPSSAAGEWHWDHNIYISGNTGGEMLQQDPASLVAQVVTDQSLQQLADVSMRPNRAYARQWSIDYARVDTGREAYDKRACFDKIVVLNQIFDRQNNDTSSKGSSWHNISSIAYDYVLLLSSDAVIISLDDYIFENLQNDNKLVAISGWNFDGHLDSKSDVVFFNLQHPYAEIVARQWLNMALSLDQTCGDNTDLYMLISVIEAIKAQDENLDSLLERISISSEGFLGQRLIKSVPVGTPEARTSFLSRSFQESIASVQETADSVCYRFYPRCDVLPALK